MIIRSRAPLRLGLAGGGTDISAYHDIYGGYVLNGTIDRYAYTTIKLSTDADTHFYALDLQKQKQINLDQDIVRDGVLDLHTELYKVVMREYNNGEFLPIIVSTFCESEPGSGLGSSSTLVVCMIQAYVELLNLPLDFYAIAHLAYRVERINCGFQGGKQDQYSATFGGFNFMEFYGDDKTIINPLRLHGNIIAELEASLILCYTGISRDSSKIIMDQSKNIQRESTNSLDAMHEMKEQALSMKEFLLTGDMRGFVSSMKVGWENKKRSSNSVSNQFINDIYDAALNAGAESGKISGAGGGGYFMFFAPVESRMSVIRALNKMGIRASNCHFVSEGSYSWRM